MVNTEPNANTWQIHLKGLLALQESIKNHTRSRLPDHLSDRTAACLFRTNLAEHSHSETLNIERGNLGSSSSHPQTTFHLTYVLHSRLNDLAPELDDLFNTGSKPRKLDVQRVRVMAKRLYKDLGIALTTLQSQDTVSTEGKYEALNQELKHPFEAAANTGNGCKFASDVPSKRPSRSPFSLLLHLCSSLTSTCKRT